MRTIEKTGMVLLLAAVCQGALAVNLFAAAGRFDWQELEEEAVRLLSLNFSRE